MPHLDPGHPTRSTERPVAMALALAAAPVALARRSADPRQQRPDLRVGDAERERMVERLGRAFSQGYLDLPEYERRLDAATAARTAGDLATLLTDLPPDRLPPAEAEQRRRVAARRGLAWHLAGWASTALICLAIWTVIALTSGPHYFWPIWPILGTGIGVLFHALPVLTGRHRTAI